ncbi:hypothetical protein [Magnetovibrio blakemorei]|uniref:Uncharacterized protein n=1 Tax=Magnetovibrio blakemorei TaxID=28181 RepID=A0A1E5Q5J5_9PROT|nr:hypothetical protein [Magnetovibrio blakemorei]OEJ65144.1 hypothetical protein BEN30_15800 [Magnetovibrio blakemorei]
MANVTTSGPKSKGAGQGTKTSAKPAQKTPTAEPASPAAPPYEDDDDNDEEVFASDADELAMLNQRVAETEAAVEAAMEARADFVARQAAVQAKAQYLAQQAALAAQKKAQSTSQTNNSNRQATAEPPTKPSKGFANVQGDGGDYLDVLTRVFEDLNNNDWDADQFNNASQGVSMVLGSGPAFAALGSMLANTTAQSSVLMNATQMQRQLDQVGLLCTSACVKQLLNLNNNSHDSD